MLHVKKENTQDLYSEGLVGDAFVSVHPYFLFLLLMSMPVSY